jgi:amino-acid N-acetyltransferase
MEGLPAIQRGLRRAEAIRLLESAGLPSSDLTDAHFEHFFCGGLPACPYGIVGVEFCGSDALLRSLVVIPEMRESGLGSELVKHAEHYAQSKGVRAVYLLTTTAEQFFCRRGYASTPRESAPSAIQKTREFAGLCSTSSAFLSKKLI